jgi:hypothetical protein
MIRRHTCALYKRVKTNRGAAGVDGQSIEEFDDPSYVLWLWIKYKNVLAETSETKETAYMQTLVRIRLTIERGTSARSAWG